MSLLLLQFPRGVKSAYSDCEKGATSASADDDHALPLDNGENNADYSYRDNGHSDHQMRIT